MWALVLMNRYRKGMVEINIHLKDKIFSLNFRWHFMQDAIFRVVAAILHLGNVEFTEGSEADSSVPKDEKSQFHLKTAAELFMY